MSLPTSKTPAAQPSIRSFFQAKAPKYASPPSTTSRDTNGTNHAPAAQQKRKEEGAVSPPQPTLDAPIPPPATNLPREASIRPVAADDTPALRRINALLLPVSYPDSFYQRAVDPAASARFSRVVTWAHVGEEPKVVGGVVCRVEQPPGAASQNLYIQSLCLLSPYRGMGLINAALDNIVATAVADPNLDVKTITAHVWTENEEALHWYEGRAFKRHEPALQGYYIKLRPGSAWLVQRDVSASVRSSLPPAPASSGASRTVAASTTAAVVNLPAPLPPPSSWGPNSNASTPPPGLSRGQSFQTQRPETEWNDLPADMAPGLLAPPRKPSSESTSGTSSRSSSTARKKRDRSYPAAAFGS
ncbi:N-alpha-acetyltransferase 50 [Tolypocladium ophioglossoides CBS 100239]|uniref:N-alpha-acetyltransferase 50 n=1 Tax=Tolypocladium ophioglossoides (strain CBS 100239) TaxID=1163406 RepID=A0A0L0N771_TOLOC|nr:N-alpha-acetyltransferase 50 [Tolypocladium ophioglossoides CBS 100239]